MSSFSCSCICVLVHTSLVDTAVETKMGRSRLAPPQNQTERMALPVFLSPKLVGKFHEQSVWIMALFYVDLVLQHLIERVTYTRGIFQSDEDEGLQCPSSSVVVSSIVDRKSVTYRKKVWEKYKELSSGENSNIYPNESRETKGMAAWGLCIDSNGNRRIH